MIEFQYLHIKDRPQFKDQFFDLTQKGINLVLGYNTKTGSNNGVGKSLFFGELADFLAEDSVSGTKQDRVRRGTVKFGVKRGEILYECERGFSPREKITVWKNGEDLGLRELSAAREYIRHHVVPYGEQEVVSYLYLDLANGAHPLVTGTTATRKQFFRSFFKQIDDLANIRKIVDSAVSKTAEAARRYEEIQSVIQTLKGAIPEDIDETEAGLASLEKELSDVQSDASQISRAVTLRESITELDAEVPDELRISSAELEQLDKDLRSRVRKAREQLSLIEAHEEWVAENAKTSKKLSELRSTLDGFPSRLGKMSRKELQDELASVIEKHTSVSTFKVNTERAIRMSGYAVRQAKDDLKALRHKEEHLTESAGSCPTCGQAYDNKSAKAELEDVRSMTRERTKFLKTSQSALDAASEGFDPEACEAQLAVYVERQAKIQSVIDTVTEIGRLSARVTDEPELPGASRSKLERVIESIGVKRNLIEKSRSRATLKDEWDALPKHVRRASADSSGTMDRILSLTEEISGLRVLVAEASVRRDDLRTKISERKELKLAKKDFEELQLLQAAFSRKGVEKEMITSACSMLEDQVNRYAKHVFTEDFEFSFDLETNFEITVKRKFGKRIEESDVRKLSGAEKRLFSMVLLVALLSFVPKKDRSSLLILDEPTATMGEDNKANFVRFLPVLNTVIPTIVVITPLEPKDYTLINPRVFTVVKTGPSSKIEEGTINGATIRNRIQQPELAGRGSGVKPTRRTNALRSKK